MDGIRINIDAIRSDMDMRSDIDDARSDMNVTGLTRITFKVTWMISELI